MLCAPMVTTPTAAFAAGAKGETSEEDPEGLIQQGVRLRRAGHDDRAEGYLRRAYKLARTPRSAAQLGLVEFALGQLLSAESHISEAMANPDDTWVAGNWATLEKTRTKVRSQLGHVEVVGAPPGARIAVNGGLPTPLPNDGDVWVVPGKVVLSLVTGTETMTSPPMTVGAAGVARWGVPAGALAPAPMAVPVPSSAARPSAGTESAQASPPAKVSADRPPSTTAADDRNGGSLRMTGLVMAPAGVVVGAVGYLLLARGNAMADNITNSQASGTRYNESDSRYGTYQKAGLGLIVGGAAVAVTGVILYLVGRQEPGATPEDAGRQAQHRPRWLPKHLRFSLNPRLSPADATILGVGGVL